MGWGHPGTCLFHDPLLVTPRRALPFSCPCATVPLLLRAQERGTGEKQGVRLVWLVTNTAGFLPVCPPGSPSGACGLLTPALPSLCLLTPLSQPLLSFSGLHPRAGRTREERPSQAHSRTTSVRVGCWEQG